jgi:hypothetical protein
MIEHRFRKYLTRTGWLEMVKDWMDSCVSEEFFNSNELAIMRMHGYWL